MEKYKVQYTIKISNITPSLSLEVNQKDVIIDREDTFEIEDENITEAELEEKIKESIRIEDELHNIINIK